MNTILSFFNFHIQNIGYVFGRLGVELLLCVFLIYLVALIIVQSTKKRQQSISFSNWVKVCFMYGIDAAIVMMGVIVILTIRMNGLHFFTIDALSWSWYCGYLLMLPELIVFCALIAVYVVLEKSIHKSIN